MQFSTLALIAASVAPAIAQTGSDWVTYTKDLGSTSVIVTRYLGTSTELTGTEWTTKTVIKTSNGTPVYTELVTAPAASETTTTAVNTSNSSNTTTTTATVSTYTGAAAKLGFSLGALAVIGACLV